jgi:uncharacterized protein (DUF58 family)
MLVHGTSRIRSLSVTPEGTRFLLFAVAVAIAAVNTGNNLFYLLLAMLLSLILISGLLSGQCIRRLAFRRQVPDYVFANTPEWVSLTVSNHKRRVPAFSLRICDIGDGHDVDGTMRIPHLAPLRSTVARYIIRAPHRGFHRLKGVHVSTPFPFGLFHKSAYYPAETTILVCPELIPLPASILDQLTAVDQTRSLMRRGPGMALYNLREYRPGDDSRAIHWMTTARTSKLMLKETEAEDQRAVTLVLPLTAPATDTAAFERAVSVTASLAAYFHAGGYAIRALVGDMEIGPSSGWDNYIAILKALALCERQEPGSPPSDQPRPNPTWLHPDSALIVAVTSKPADTALQTVVDAADCIVTTAKPEGPDYVARPSLRS